MSKDPNNGGNREEVPLERIVLSNMYSIKAIIDVLVEDRKGNIAISLSGPTL